MNIYNDNNDSNDSFVADCFGQTFALIGRNPKCGCPLAIDMNPTKESQEEFDRRGLLLEFLAEGAAQQVWGNSSWPCHHSKTVLDD